MRPLRRLARTRLRRLDPAPRRRRPRPDSRLRAARQSQTLPRRRRLGQRRPRRCLPRSQVPPRRRPPQRPPSRARRPRLRPRRRSPTAGSRCAKRWRDASARIFSAASGASKASDCNIAKVTGARCRSVPASPGRPASANDRRRQSEFDQFTQCSWPPMQKPVVVVGARTTQATAAPSPFGARGGRPYSARRVSALPSSPTTRFSRSPACCSRRCARGACQRSSAATGAGRGRDGLFLAPAKTYATIRFYDIIIGTKPGAPASGPERPMRGRR